MNKQSVAYSYNGTLFSHKNEVPMYAKTWMNLKDIMVSERSQTHKDKYCMMQFIRGT